MIYYYLLLLCLLCFVCSQPTACAPTLDILEDVIGRNYEQAFPDAEAVHESVATQLDQAYEHRNALQTQASAEATTQASLDVIAQAIVDPTFQAISNPSIEASVDATVAPSPEEPLFADLATTCDLSSADLALPESDFLPTLVNTYNLDDGAVLRGFCDGKGVLKLRDKTVYRGIFVQGKLHGHGRADFPDGRVYIGMFIGGHICGKGVMHYRNGISQHGDFSNAFLSSHSVMPLPTERFLQASFVKARINGFGSIQLPDWRVIMGNFIDGEMNPSLVTLTWLDGTLFKGAVSAGKLQSHQKITLADGYISKERRIYRKGIPYKGYIELFPDGVFSIGCYVDWYRHGRFLWIWPDGKQMIVRYRHGVREGAIDLLDNTGHVVITVDQIDDPRLALSETHQSRVLFENRLREVYHSEAAKASVRAIASPRLLTTPPTLPR